MKREDFEIMAPVGSYETLRAAIQGKANSVYFGVSHLNMRSKSTNNFTFDDLHQLVEICQENGLKSYLTANTIIYDHDLPLMRKMLQEAKKAGITAIIASDQAVINFAHELGLEIHISTQLNVSNTETLKFYANYADVMVTARELSLNQVRAITDQIKKENIRGPKGELIKIELFAHGALCQAVSGKCYLSLHEKNASANRGSCLQTCRKAYIVTEKETGYELEIDNEYIMSPKDLNTIHFINKILDAGVSVLKIEGRARSAEYVKTVCECYDEAIHAYINGNYTEEKIKDWMNRLSQVFNRGFWDGYYLGRKLGEWSHKYGSQASKRKVYIGKISNYFSKLGVAEITMEAGELMQNDELLIIGSTTGLVKEKAEEIRVNLIKVEKSIKGERCSVSVNELVRRNDKVYKWVDTRPDLEQ